MIRICVLVTGSTGSGKSTLIDRLAERGWHTAHTGEMVRRFVKPTDSGAEAIAPAHLDDKVWGVVESMLTSSHCGDVAIECVPRNAAQLQWIEHIRDLGYVPIVIRTVAPMHVREARVRNRDCMDPKRLELDLKKLAAEGDDFGSASHFTGLLHSVPHTTVNTGTRGSSMDFQPELPLLDSMMSMAVGVHDKRSGSKEINVVRMIHRCGEELHEAVGSMAYENGMGVREELVDAAFFLLVAMQGIGMTPSEVFSLFVQKYRVNVHRADTGAKPHVKDLMVGQPND